MRLSLTLPNGSECDLADYVDGEWRVPANLAGEIKAFLATVPEARAIEIDLTLYEEGD